MRLERYSGIYSATVNPANTAFNPQRWDVSLFSGDVFLENSYAFVRKASIPKLLNNSENIVSVADTSAENPLAPGALLADFFEGRRRMHAVMQARVTGPAFSFQVGENHTFGLLTAVRTGASIYRIPGNLNFFSLDANRFGDAVEVKPVSFSAMSWAEIGLHYGYRNFDDENRVTSFGITPKLLLGFEGLYARTSDAFQYTRFPGDTVFFDSGNWQYGLTTGNLSDNADSVRLRVNGAGFGLDLGFAWAQPDEEGDGGADYLWRAGVSLIDLGFVRFNKQAEKHNIRFDNTVVVGGSAFDNVDNAQEAIRQISQSFLADPDESLSGRAFSIALPTALSAQFDYKAAKYFYVGGLLVQRVPLSKQSLKRPNTLAVVPRFEHRWGSVSLPLVFDDWRAFRVGLAARLAFLSIGTDNLGSWVGQKRLSGTDFYVGLKINGFQLGSGKRHNTSGGGGPSRRNWRKIKCYEF